MWTVNDKYECARRELHLRIRVYARSVRAGKMTQERASKEISMMDAIVEDYRKLVMNETGEPPLIHLAGYHPAESNADSEN